MPTITSQIEVELDILMEKDEHDLPIAIALIKANQGYSVVEITRDQYIDRVIRNPHYNKATIEEALESWFQDRKFLREKTGGK